MKRLSIVIVACALLAGCGEARKIAGALDTGAGWAPWSKSSAAVYSGASRIVSDPSVIADEFVFRLVYTSVDFANPAGPHASISRVRNQAPRNCRIAADVAKFCAAAKAPGTRISKRHF